MKSHLSSMQNLPMELTGGQSPTTTFSSFLSRRLHGVLVFMVWVTSPFAVTSVMGCLASNTGCSAGTSFSPMRW